MDPSTDGSPAQSALSPWCCACSVCGVARSVVTCRGWRTTRFDPRAPPWCSAATGQGVVDGSPPKRPGDERRRKLTDCPHRRLSYSAPPALSTCRRHRACRAAGPYPPRPEEPPPSLHPPISRNPGLPTPGTSGDLLLDILHHVGCLPDVLRRVG
jgi:hypothetical protein